LRQGPFFGSHAGSQTRLSQPFLGILGIGGDARRGQGRESAEQSEGILDAEHDDNDDQEDQKAGVFLGELQNRMAKSHLNAGPLVTLKPDLDLSANLHETQ
jgi:hypothetical protein